MRRRCCCPRHGALFVFTTAGPMIWSPYGSVTAYDETNELVFTGSADVNGRVVVPLPAANVHGWTFLIADYPRADPKFFTTDISSLDFNGDPRWHVVNTGTTSHSTPAGAVVFRINPSPGYAHIQNIDFPQLATLKVTDSALGSDDLVYSAATGRYSAFAGSMQMYGGTLWSLGQVRLFRTPTEAQTITPAAWKPTGGAFSATVQFPPILPPTGPLVTITE